MRRETPEELQQRIADADRKLPQGRFIRHVKSGGEYLVCGHTLRESDLETLVIYSPKFEPAFSFARPLQEVIAKFVLSDGEQWTE